MRVLSVDLGTSNTVAVLAAHGRPPRVVEVDGSATMPSAVYCEEDGTLVVGRDAERRARLDPARFEPNPKRRVDDGVLLLGDNVVPVTDALAAVLRRVLDETNRQLGGESLDEIRLTHPAQWGLTRRNVLLSAARLSGAKGEVVLVPEPVAAASHYASLAVGQALAVYDLGAGTFDVAIVGATQNGFTVLAEDGLQDLGGLDVDQALLEHVGRQVSHRDPAAWQRLLRPESTADRRARRALQEDVRAAKESLSRHAHTEVPMPEPFEDVLVNRSDLEALVRPSMMRSVELLESTIRSTGMAPNQLAGIYLVGGASRIPLVATMIAEQVRIVPTSLDQPETSVALGAHHVPKDGVTPRSQETARPKEPDTVVTKPVNPNAGGGYQVNPATSGAYQVNPNAGGGYQVNPATSGAYQVNPNASGAYQVNPGVSGPYQVNPNASGAYQVNPNASGPYQVNPQTGPQQFNFPSVTRRLPAEKKKPSRTMLISVGAAVVVLALAVVGGLVAFSGPGVPTAQDCKNDTQQDDKGFTECLRRLAGTIPDTSTCKAGGTPGVGGVNAIKGTVVSCAVKDDYSVQYVLTETVVGAQHGAEAVVQSLKSDMVEAQWAGNGLKGKYRAAADGGLGLLVFTADDLPLLGIVTKSGGEELTADQVADFFEAAVQPGT
ncbi:actin-like ATPase involved in cell morphogenesis [Saccharothrix ecbatanensis]|uniref:Actin-like ATPase involved in cell morphogenesis n=1 Tax=Saccharothrix ecbatanensis TaxID=1105145 RepID=A0A7W9M5V4_9PSEU|nr:Hsp70 family protein [Saccharothrix ecbatanensis]MBB5808525.1 actin-like ATPase involved in cell morphogenesis [Saccharothrix ecbatanensis]